MQMMTLKILPYMLNNNKKKVNVFMDEIHNIVNNSGIIVYPTETLYAIGASALDAKAISKIYSIKKRPRKKPISIAVHDITEMKKYVVTTDLSDSLAKRFLPGPLTLVLNNRGILSGIKDSKLGVRIPLHPVARKITEVCGPLTVTSANIHGARDPIDVITAQKQLGSKIDIYIDGGKCRIAKGSTVVDLSNDKPRIIREGAIPKNILEKYINAT